MGTDDDVLVENVPVAVPGKKGLQLLATLVVKHEESLFHLILHFHELFRQPLQLGNMRSYVPFRGLSKFKLEVLNQSKKTAIKIMK